MSLAVIVLGLLFLASLVSGGICLIVCVAASRDSREFEKDSGEETSRRPRSLPLPLRVPRLRN